jgi:glycosyltransferase involved in cell wall biosynthesis
MDCRLSNRVEILIDVTGSCRSAKNTGVQRVTRGIYAELAARGSLTAICWNRVGNFYHLLGEPESEYLIAPFRKYRAPVGRPDLRGEKLPGELRRYFRRRPIAVAPALQKGSILLVPDIYFDERTRLLPEALRHSTGRSVAIFHDAATLSLGMLSPAAASAFRRYVESLAAFDHVICISEQSRSDLLELWRQYGIKNVPETCVEGWPLAVEPNKQALNGQRNGTKTVLCISSFEQRKNHLRLLEAAEHLWSTGCEFELRLVGRSTGAWGRKVVPRIHWLQAKGRPISWLKHVDDHTLLRAYRECHFTVYPSLGEGFGLPIIESLSHGKPCICGRNGALGEIATAGGCLLVDQTNVAELAHAMRQLVNDKETHSSLASNARERRFRSWSEYGTTLVDYLYDQETTSSSSRADIELVSNTRKSSLTLGNGQINGHSILKRDSTI